MIRTSSSRALIGLIALSGFLGRDLIAAPVQPLREQDLLKIADRLKPIPDDEWMAVAGERVDQRYDVIKGDTLSSISQRLFGDSRYWPKIWALNHSRITNPHWIYPGYQVAFMPGTGTSLPGVAIVRSRPMTDAPEEWGGSKPPKHVFQALADSPREKQWESLPRQSWEYVPPPPPSQFDSSGFDKTSRVIRRVGEGFELELLAASQSIVPLGVMHQSREEAIHLVAGDTVFIRGNGSLRVGQVYSLVNEPVEIEHSNSDRSCYSYAIAGEVRITGQNSEVFVGTILRAKYFLTRGAILIPHIPKIKGLQPVATAERKAATLILDHRFGIHSVVEGKTVFIDRGSADGIVPGNVFRAYRHTDPVDEGKITDDDFVIDADVIVTYVSEKFSVGRVFRTFAPVLEGARIVSLTDVSDLREWKGFKEGALPPAEINTTDELDLLHGDPLTDEEKREVEQLEKWRENPPDAPQPLDSSATDVPSTAPLAPEPDVLAPEGLPAATPPVESTEVGPVEPLENSEPPPPPPPTEEPVEEAPLPPAPPPPAPVPSDAPPSGDEDMETLDGLE